MSQHASAHHARLQLEHLEARCTPSALPGSPPAPPGELPALAADLADGTQQHAVHLPIMLSAHIKSDGTGRLSLTGVGTHLGSWTGEGIIKPPVMNTDANQITITVVGTATLTAANGAKLYVSISVLVDPTTGKGTETLHFTGGTGRFAGASGDAIGVCDDVTFDPASFTFECNSQASGTLVLPRPS